MEATLLARGDMMTGTPVNLSVKIYLAELRRAKTAQQVRVANDALWAGCR